MIEKLKDWALNLPLVISTIKLSKRLVLPGFDGLPIFYVGIFFWNGIQKGLLATKASSLAFKFFMAIFPTIIFIVTLIPLIPINNFQLELLAILNDLLPTSAYNFAEETLIEIIVQPNQGLLSFGFVFAIYLATNGLDGLLTAFKDSYNTTFTRSAVQQKMLSVALLFILTILIVIAIAAIVSSEVIIYYFLEETDTIGAILLILGKWLIIMLLCFFAISFMYYLGGNRSMKWRFFSAGSTLATFLVIIVSVGFAFYVDNFANYNKIYGSIGTLIVVMLWIYFNSLVLLIGFELNASIQQAGSIHKVKETFEDKRVASVN
ncbi:YihY/virulence factor BrkB family protein [Vicingaceae bacterium]|jgi:membrane protein|nr:YihY/virulence factor BrkB family protein [Vicingaceae bacterium]